MIGNGAEIGTLKLGDVTVVGDVGATLDQSGQFTVTNVDHLTEFTKVQSIFINISDLS